MHNTHKSFNVLLHLSQTFCDVIDIENMTNTTTNNNIFLITSEIKEKYAHNNIIHSIYKTLTRDNVQL